MADWKLFSAAPGSVFRCGGWRGSWVDRFFEGGRLLPAAFTFRGLGLDPQLLLFFNNGVVYAERSEDSFAFEGRDARVERQSLFAAHLDLVVVQADTVDVCVEFLPVFDQ